MTVNDMLVELGRLQRMGKGEYDLTVWVWDGSEKLATEVTLFQNDPIIDDNVTFVVFDLDQ